MQYTVNHNGASCTLPAFTKRVKEEIDKVNEQISNTDIPLDSRIDSMYHFLQDTLQEDFLQKVLGSTDIDDIDLNNVNILYLKVCREYDRPVQEFNKPDLLDEDTKKMLREMDKMTQNLSTISRYTKK